MNKQRAFIIAGSLILCTVLLVFLFSGKSEEETVQKAFVSDNWEQEFFPDHKGPLGLYLFRDMLAGHTGKPQIMVEDSLEKALDDSLATYIYAGDEFVIQDAEFDSLIKQVKKGSDLFLSFHQLTDHMIPYFFHSSANEWHYEETITVYTDSSSYQLFSVFQTDTVARRWNLISAANLRDTNFRVLTSFMETPNFVQLNAGKGRIFLHSNPELFLNYQLLTKSGYAHAKIALSRIRKDRPVKWLELARYSPYFGNSDTDEMEGQGLQVDDSALQFLFKRQALVIAFLLSILGVILYLIFRTRRVFPVMPYIPGAKNRSLDFAQTMKAIYYTRQTPYDILLVMRKNFYAIVSKQFFLDISKKDKTREISILAEKTGIPREQIEEITGILDNRGMAAVTYEQIYRLAKLQRTFYIESGIIQSKLVEKVEKKDTTILRRTSLMLLFVGAGIFFILSGLYILQMSGGRGIVYVLIGILTVIVNAWLLNRPILVIGRDQFTHYPSRPSKRKVYEMNDIIEVTVSRGSTLILLTGNRKVRIRHFEIKPRQRHAFEKFIAPYIG